ncbi:hypothetical protein GGD41_003077 [Paraburkholderia bryophila]|uniref:Uncharacterized protein n=1 Tax=Paraburkholderia bryophila TaxID=420952 RepID=A0A7Y9W7V3_9BURK|nr:hypothetical protein [Paraburkholderia bryophila]
MRVAMRNAALGLLIGFTSGVSVGAQGRLRL